MSRPLARLLGIFAAVVGVIAMLAFARLGIFLSSDRGAPPPSGELEDAALGSPVRILRDPLGVAHVYAERSLDVYYGLGFVHAQDRLWQMEMLRRQAQGRLAEVFGPEAVPEDRLARMLGFAMRAQRELRSLRGPELRALEAYAAGVNRWIAEVEAGRATAAFEFRWLGLEPSAWRAEDSLAILRLGAWLRSATLGATLLLDRLVREEGGLLSQDLFPEAPRSRDPGLARGLLELGLLADRYAERAGMRGPVGSLGLAVGATRSRSGKPLLAVDPHVEFQLPALYFPTHVSSRDLEVSGGTWPGVPVFWVGTNRRIAWGPVSLHASVSEIYHETLHPSDPNRYERGDRWSDLERRSETIGVRGRAPETFEVAETRHGPLLRALELGDPLIDAYALSWTGDAEESGIDGHLALHRARDWPEFRAALARIPAPLATYLYADADGQIGRQVAGRLPVREVQTGMLPVPGRSPYYDWRGFVPFEALPSEVGAQLDAIVASTRGEAAEFPAPVVWLWQNGGGAERLRTHLRHGERLDLAELLALQSERHSARGVRLVQRLLRGVEPRTEGARRVRERLLTWDGSTDVDAEGAALFHAFRQRLTRRLLERRFANRPQLWLEVARAEPVPGVALERFVDRATRREDPELVARALDETWNWLGVHLSPNPRKWRWGELHRLLFSHGFARQGRGLLAWVGRRLGRGPFPVPGDADSVWTMHHRDLPTQQVAVGPAFRYAIDLADPANAQFGLAGGQSGHPGAAHYDDAIADWLHARPRTLWMQRQTIEYYATGTWLLRPPHGER
jgi:penicillin amidase